MFKLIFNCKILDIVNYEKQIGKETENICIYKFSSFDSRHFFGVYTIKFFNELIRKINTYGIFSILFLIPLKIVTAQ